MQCHDTLRRSGVLLVMMGVLWAGCREEADTARFSGVSMALADPLAARYLVEAQEALYRGFVGDALAYVDSAEQQAGLKTDAFLADLSFLRGRIYGELHQVENALKAYEVVLAFNPKYQGAWLNMGNLAFRGGQFGESLHHYRKEYEVSGNPNSLVYMGRGYAELGMADSARAAYERALVQDDSLAEAYIRLAVLHDDNGEVEQALSYAQRALALRPEDPDYRYIVGQALLQHGAITEAEAHFRQTIEQVPGHSKAHYGLGIALSRSGLAEEASYYMTRVDSLRRIEESIETFERRTRLYPEDPAAWVTLGYALARAGRGAEAIRALQVALHRGPAVPDVHMLLANEYMKQQRLGEALVHYEATLHHDASFVGAWVNKGICLVRMGNPDAARQAWETALRLDPGQPRVRKYLADLRG